MVADDFTGYPSNMEWRKTLTWLGEDHRTYPLVVRSILVRMAIKWGASAHSIFMIRTCSWDYHTQIYRYLFNQFMTLLEGLLRKFTSLLDDIGPLLSSRKIRLADHFPDKPH